MEFQSKISFLNKDTSNGNCNASTKLLFMDVHKNKWNWLTKRKEIRLIRFHGIDSIELSLTSHSKRDPKKISTYSSMPNLINKYYEKVKLKSSSSLTHMWKHSNRFRAQLIESDHRLKPQSNIYNGRQFVKLCVYQCQFRPGQECRCCSCNSDSMFEVMKSLYDCYKKKNCDYCKCILCGHLPVQERKIAESRQSFASIGQVISIKVKKQKPKKIVRCKSPAEKEEFLNEVALSDASLPEGKTSCDKGVICGFTVPVSSIRNVISSEKIRTAGLITPLAGKTLEEKEKILRGLAMSGITLPEGKTASEKKLIDKMRIELGLPPEPRTSAAREKYKKAAASGLLIPLEGKSAAQKKKMLRAQANLGIALPKGRTASEKILIEKIKIENGKQPQTKNSFEKLPKAKEAGLLTPLTEKTPEQKEKILRGQAAAGLPLPDGKTASEKALIEKIKREVGINLTPLSSEAKKLDEQTAKVMKGGKRPFISCILTPESGKFSAKTPSEKFRKAKEAGLLTPLEEKSQEHKEKILRGLVKQGIPLPEGKTASKKKLTDKIRHDMGLPPEPKTSPSKERYTRAQALGLITPLEGKSATHKEKILRVQAAVGLPLPEGRTPSEKALIQKVKKEVNKLSATRIRLEKFRKAKEAGLLSPLTGKTPVQKEKILREMAARGIPVPEGKTASEKKLLEIVRRDMGLPPEPKTSSMKAKYNKAVANGIIVPLEGKTIHEKEKILKAIKEAGIPLPEGRTASDKFLIRKIQASSVAAAGVPSAKIRATKGSLLIPLTGKTTPQKVKVIRSLAERDIFLAEPRTASEKKIMGNTKVKEIPSKRTPLSEEAKELDKQTANINRDGAAYKWIYGILTTESHTFSLEAKPSKISSEKLRKQKSTSFLTPLDGKSAAEKEKIVKGLAEAGLPLPKGKTASEKVLLQKIKAEYGIPPDAKTASEKEIVRKAKAEGLLTPLKGKSRAEKEKNLKGLAQAGLPMPEGKTASEKALIKSIRRTTGLPPTPTPSEKLGEIKTKSKRVGEGLFSIRTIARAVGDKCEAGIVENFQGEAKTTTCDRRCGCDKKKIKFKHSYVKIKVTCPNECVPMCADDEGIKITVGSAIGFPSFILSVHALKLKDKNLRKEKHSNSSEDSSYATDDDSTNIKLKEQMHKPNDHSTHKVKSVEKLDEQIHRKEHFIYEYMIDTLRNYEKLEDSSKVSKNLVTTFSSDEIGLLNSPDTLYNSDSGSGLDSLILLMTESSLSFSSSSNSSIITNAATINVKSRNSENVSPTSSHNICIEESACSTIFSERKDDEGYFTSDFKSNCNNTRQR